MYSLKYLGSVAGVSITPRHSSCPLGLYIRALLLSFFMAKRQQSWCFTLNNYTEDEHETLLKALEECKYFIVGKEVGDGGTPHLQGFAVFPRRYYFNVVRDKLGHRIHLEGARGTARQNRVYCSKGGDFIERGEIPKEGGSGNRSAVASSFSERITEGHRGIAEFASEYPAEWYFSGFNLLRNHQLLTLPIERPDVVVEWVWGAPGVGKSRYAHDKYTNAYIKEPRTKWWNGYLQEKEVIIDDFGPGGIDLNHFLRWFDRYKCLVETKGGMVALYADKFIVTSNFHPDDCWKDKEGISHPQMDALYRRISINKME